MSGAMKRQPSGTRSSCGRHMSAFSGNAWMRTTGQPLPASRYRSVRPSIVARDSRTMSSIIAVMDDDASVIDQVSDVTRRHAMS